MQPPADVCVTPLLPASFEWRPGGGAWVLVKPRLQKVDSPVTHARLFVTTEVVRSLIRRRRLRWEELKTINTWVITGNTVVGIGVVPNTADSVRNNCRHTRQCSKVSLICYDKIFYQFS